MPHDTDLYEHAAIAANIRCCTEAELRSWLRETDAGGRFTDAVLNPSSVETIRRFYLDGAKEEYASVFASTPYAPLMSKSPLFIEFGPYSDFADTLLYSEEAWGFAALGHGDRKNGLAHWRSLLNAVLPDGTITHFRFYSGSVLLKTAQACTETELVWLMGPYAWFVIPAARDGEEPETMWHIIDNPTLKDQSAKDIGGRYLVMEKNWWQVSDRHLKAFENVTGQIYLKNLTVWLWEKHNERIRAFYAIYGEAYTDRIAHMLDEIRQLGFADKKHQSRLLAAVLPFVNESGRHPVQVKALEPIRQLLSSIEPDDLESTLSAIERIAQTRSQS